MKIALEGKTFELNANGYFMKKYQQTFKTNMMQDLALAAQGGDYLRLAQLTFCAIQNMDCTFDEWLNSFETPCFLRPDNASAILEYLARDTEPTVVPEKAKETSDGSKKKKN